MIRDSKTSIENGNKSSYRSDVMTSSVIGSHMLCYQWECFDETIKLTTIGW